MKRKLAWLMVLVLLFGMYTIALGEPDVSVGEMTLADEPSTAPVKPTLEGEPDNTGTPTTADPNKAPADEAEEPNPAEVVVPTPIPEAPPVPNGEVPPSPVPEVEPDPAEGVDPAPTEEADPDPITPVPITEVESDPDAEDELDPPAEVAPLEHTDYSAVIDVRLDDSQCDPLVAVLSCRLIGLDISDVQLQWEVDDGSGWVDINGATDSEYRVEVTPQAIACNWRVKVVVIGA